MRAATGTTIDSPTRGDHERAPMVMARTAQMARHDVSQTVNVPLADPARDTRQLLAKVLAHSGIGRVIVADSVAAVDDVIAGHMPGKLALISLAFGEASDRLIRGLLQAQWPRVIALAPTMDTGPVLDAVLAGACGVLRGHPKAPVIKMPHVHELTQREVEVLSHVADGRSNKWIGEQLNLSALTVKSHLARISRKLRTGDRAQMVAIAMRAGLIR
jgi:DNA-binding CsgD family transcriptional regulator